jgi:solute carrier family 25 folate transporter 32
MSTYPYQVIRARLQDHNTSYKGVRDCFMQTWGREGIRGMYKGALIGKGYFSSD